MNKLALLLLAAFFATATASVPFFAATSTAEAAGKAKKAKAKKSVKKKAMKKRSVKRSRVAAAKSCGTFKYRKGGKCMDARNKR